MIVNIRYALKNIRNEFKSIDNLFDFQSEGLTLKLESGIE